MNRRDHYHHWATDQLAEIKIDVLASNSAAYHLLNKVNNGTEGLLTLLEQEFIIYKIRIPGNVILFMNN